MAYHILWSDFALGQAAEFFDFIAEENPAAAKRVVEDLFDRVGALAEHPLLGRPLSQHVDSSLRRFVVGNYIVLYRVDEARQTVDIIAARHFRQRPLPYEEL